MYVISFYENLVLHQINVRTHLKHAQIDLNRNKFHQISMSRTTVENFAENQDDLQMVVRLTRFENWLIRYTSGSKDSLDSLWCKFWWEEKSPMKNAVCLWCLLILMSSPFPIHLGFWSPKNILPWFLACFLVHWEWEQRDEPILLAQMSDLFFSFQEPREAHGSVWISNMRIFCICSCLIVSRHSKYN